VQLFDLQQNRRWNSEIVFLVDYSKRGGAEGAEISLGEGRVSDHSFNQFM